MTDRLREGEKEREIKDKKSKRNREEGAGAGRESVRMRLRKWKNNRLENIVLLKFSRRVWSLTHWRAVYWQRDEASAGWGTSPCLSLVLVKTWRCLYSTRLIWATWRQCFYLHVIFRPVCSSPPVLSWSSELNLHFLWNSAPSGAIKHSDPSETRWRCVCARQMGRTLHKRTWLLSWPIARFRQMPLRNCQGLKTQFTKTTRRREK